MARRGRRETAGRFAAWELRRLALQVVFAGVVLVLFVYMVGPLLAQVMVDTFTHTMVHATPLASP